VFYSQCIDRQAARGEALVAVEAGVGRRSGINHGEIWLELLDETIIPGLNFHVNNTRVKLEPNCFFDWRIGIARGVDAKAQSPSRANLELLQAW
jgi:hypothetical protein